METMQWSEISVTAASQTAGGVVNDHHRPGNSENRAPTIKNHSVTYFNDHLYCFGGYDGRRNHNLLLLYNIKEHRWIRPQAVAENEFNSPRVNIESESHNTTDSVVRASHEGTDVSSESISNTNNNNENTENTALRETKISFGVDTANDDETNYTGNENAETNRDDDDTTENDDANDDSNNDSAEDQINESQEEQNQQHRSSFDKNTYNREIPSRNEREGFYHGMNANGSNITYEYTVTGNPPPGRNGHSATLATDEDDDNDDDEHVTGRIIVLGGWLGQGPLAASDMHVLDISRGGRTLRWYQPAIKGTPPGPCNMHSADYVKARKEVFVFRGGNGEFFVFFDCFCDLFAFHDNILFLTKNQFFQHCQAVNT